MPDISMCYGAKVYIKGTKIVASETEVCPSRGSCYRHTASASRWQSYGQFYKGQDQCEYYWPDRNKSD